MKKSEALNFISDFTDNNDMDFKQCLNGYETLKEIAEEYPEYSPYVLSAISFSAKKDVFCADLAPSAMRVFVAAAQNTDETETMSCLNGLFDKNLSFALMCNTEILQERPQLADHVFAAVMSRIDRMEPNNTYRYTKAVGEAVKNSDRAPELLDEAMRHPRLASSLYGSLGSIYKSRPETGRQIVEMLENKKYLTASNYAAFYNNLETLVLLNEKPAENTVYTENYGNTQLAEAALSLMERHITDKGNDAKSLTAAYKTAKHIGEIIPAYKERMEAVIRRGLEHKNNTKISQKAAYRALGDFDKLCSRAEVYQRGKKTEESPYGISSVLQPDNEKPCVLVLGGDGVRSEQALNGYMGDVYRLLEENRLDGAVNVYGVVYDFGEYMDVRYARNKMMKDHHRQVKLKDETPADTVSPKYIQEIFDRFVMPRISKDGKKIDAEAAARNVRKLNIVAHCHGAYTALMLEEMMQGRMKELGYSAEERVRIQKHLLVVAQSPYCPLGESKSTFVSFASARDMETSHHNNFEKALTAIRQEEKIPFSFFPDRRGNLFLADTMGKESDEHNFWGFHGNDTIDKQGQALILMEQKVLLNGIKNSLSPQPEMPPVADLAADDNASRKLFEQSLVNGRNLYDKMYVLSMAVAKYRAQHEK